MKIRSNQNKVVKISLLFIFIILAINFVCAIENTTIIKVFKCGNTTYWDNHTEEGRILNHELFERKYKSLFEGEQIKWKVLVYDSNGIEMLEDDNPRTGYAVYATLGDELKPGNNIEVNCIPSTENIFLESCNIREYRDEITDFNSSTMKYFNCIFTVETPESMYGQKWVTVEAKDMGGSKSIMNESERWFFNPVIGININDSVDFKKLIPGKNVYSNEISVASGSDIGSEVIMDMFISGTDFSSSNENDSCPTKQTLPLDRFRYYSKNGNFDTSNLSNSDSEGYRPILYGIGFNNPHPFYNNYEMIPKNNDPQLPVYYLANQIGPDDNMKLKFKIDVPRECKGNFDSGNIYVWGEAI